MVQVLVLFLVLLVLLRTFLLETTEQRLGCSIPLPRRLSELSHLDRHIALTRNQANNINFLHHSFIPEYLRALNWLATSPTSLSSSWRFSSGTLWLFLLTNSQTSIWAALVGRGGDRDRCFDGLAAAPASLTAGWRLTVGTLWLLWAALERAYSRRRDGLAATPASLTAGWRFTVRTLWLLGAAYRQAYSRRLDRLAAAPAAFGTGRGFTWRAFRFDFLAECDTVIGRLRAWETVDTDNGDEDGGDEGSLHICGSSSW